MYKVISEFIKEHLVSLLAKLIEQRTSKLKISYDVRVEMLPVKQEDLTEYSKVDALRCSLLYEIGTDGENNKSASA
jgi:hypothetical protein